MKIDKEHIIEICIIIGFTLLIPYFYDKVSYQGALITGILLCILILYGQKVHNDAQKSTTKPKASGHNSA